ncbi:MAG: GH32 C-terminal domain-containing protein, partial [Candidatus Sumerlaeota bacterium]|nr:GH32 C-terminal domain-containing protein [Candidatus Sumerlaeota bacterium]
EGWNQIMTLPRRLTSIGRRDLRVEPAGDVESLRGERRRVEGRALPANQEIVLEGVNGNAMEIVAEIDPRRAPMVEMNVLRSPGKEEFTRISFYKNRGFMNRDYDQQGPRASWITIDSSYSSTLPDALSRAPEEAPVVVEENEPVRLRVFIDRSVVEVFVNGRQCAAVRIYPGRKDSVGVSLRSQGQDAQLLSFDSWEMKSIY